MRFADPKFNWVFGFKEFPHPTIEAFVALDAIGPTFFLAIAMFGFVLQISSLITEKELKLRQVRYYSSYLLRLLCYPFSVYICDRQ